MLTGVVLGVMVTLTSIGAGALGTVALFLLYPFLATRRLVGTEIAHAVPLTLVAGLGHAGMGNMDWSLLATCCSARCPASTWAATSPGAFPTVCCARAWPRCCC